MVRARGFRVISVVATKAAAGIPFGALAPAVELRLPRGDVRLDALMTVRRSLLEQRADGRMLLHVDDGHLLDEPSATVVHQLVTEGHVSLVMTLRTGEPAPDAVTALWKEGVVGRLDVRPLDLPDTRILLEAALGGPLETGSAAKLQTISGGNPLYLRELVRSALADGALVTDGGTWRLAGDLPPSRRLIELVSERLAVATPEDRQLLAALALAEPLGVDLLAAVMGGAAAARAQLSRVEQAGLAVTGLDGNRLQARLAHPLYGDVLRATMPTLELTDLRQRLAALLLDVGVQRDTDALRAATLQLDAGVPVKPALALAAARHARAAVDLDLAERLARVALEGGGARAGQVLAEILFHRGCFVQAEELYAELDLHAADDRERAVLGVARAFNLFWGVGDGDRAQRVLSTCEQSVGDAALREELTAERAAHALFAGHAAEALAMVADVLARPGTADRVQSRGAVSAAPALVVLGRSLDAVAMAAQGIDAAQRLPRGVTSTIHAITLEVCRSFGLRTAGMLDDATASAEQAHAAAVTSDSSLTQALAAWARGHAALARGAVTQAVADFREGAAIDAAYGMRSHQRWNLIGAALATAQSADTAGAAQLLRSIAALPPGPDRFADVDLVRARAWVAAAEGDGELGRMLLEEAAAGQGAAGHRWSQAVLLHDIARLGGAAEVDGALTGLADEVQGVLVQAMAAHAHGLAEGDATLLDDTTERFLQLGAQLLAAETAGAWATLVGRRADPATRTRAWRRAASLAARCDGARTPGLAIGVTSAELTERQREVARLAAAGLSSRRIAERLTVSVRTVDNHLLQIYGRLGISGRGELAAVLTR